MRLESHLHFVLLNFLHQLPSLVVQNLVKYLGVQMPRAATLPQQAEALVRHAGLIDCDRAKAILRKIQLLHEKRCTKKTEPENLIGQRATREVKADDGTMIVRKDKKFTKASARKMRAAGMEWIQIGQDDLIRVDAVKRVAPVDIVDEETGEVIIECNEEITEAHLDDLKARGINEFPLLFLDPITTGTAIRG